MPAAPVAVRGVGMMTSVGLDAPSTCAAIRAGVRNMSETDFVVQSDSPVLGAQVPALGGWRGRARLAKLLAGSVRDCFASMSSEVIGGLPLLVCVSEIDRPGRPADLERLILSDVERELGTSFSHDYSAVFSIGRAGGLLALSRARLLMAEHGVSTVLVAGVDSLLVGSTLAWLKEHDRLLSEDNSDGVVAGEASSCVCLDSRPARRGALVCAGIGMARERVTITSEEPFRADGLTGAVREALQEAGIAISDCALRITDLSGEHYYFREAALTLARIQRSDGCREIWHPAECIGEVGAAIGPLLIGYAAVAARREFLPGTQALIHVSSDGGERAAACFRVIHDPYVQ